MPEANKDQPQDVIRDVETTSVMENARDIGSGKVQSTGTEGATGVGDIEDGEETYATQKGAASAGESEVPT